MPDDYLMRMIQGLAGLAHWVTTLGQRPVQQDLVSQEAVTNGRLRSVGPKILAMMSVTMILGLLAGEMPSDRSVLHAASLLTDIAEEQLYDGHVRDTLHQRAVVLYDLGSATDPAGLEPHRVSAAASASAIDALPLPADVRGSLVRVLGRLGQLARAEDHLFELARTDGPAAGELGRRLYAEWATLSDEALAVGGLDRADLAAGLADLAESTTPTDRPT